MPPDPATPPFPPQAPRWRRILRWILGLATGFLITISLTVAVLYLRYTSPSPLPIAVLPSTDADRAALRDKWLQFREGLLKNGSPEPLRLSEDDLNLFFSMLPRYRGRIHLAMTHDRVHADVSLPLDGILPVLGKGRFLNGSDVFRVRLGPDRLPRVDILSATLNGKRLPRWVVRFVESPAFYGDIVQALELEPLTERLASLEVRDGALVLTPTAAR